MPISDQSIAFLKQMLTTPSPSGYEQQIQRVVRSYVEPFAQAVTTDVHGNVAASIGGSAEPRVMLAGHCDQIGLLVTHIDDEGFVYSTTVGGWDPQQLIGQRMTIWGKDGPVAAIIARKAIHLLDENERKQVVKTKELWLDIGAANKEEVQALVRVGDPVTLELGYRPMLNNFANAPGMDDSVGVWVVMEALRRASESTLNCSLHSVSTVQEEIGLRGAKTSAYGIDPHVGIAVDVTHATDCPTIDKRDRGDIRLGDGPVIFRGPNMNPVVVDRLIGVCEEKNIPYQLSAIGRPASNDANTIQVSRTGVATGLVAIPNRYMHSAVEMISLDDLDHAAELLAQFAMRISSGDDFTP